MNKKYQTPYEVANSLPEELRLHAKSIFPNLYSQEIPYAPEQETLNPIEEQPLEQSTQLQKPETIQQVQEVQKVVEEPSVQEIPEIQQQQAITNTDEMIQEANERARSARLAGQMARVRDAVIGVGLGRPIQTDLSTYEGLEKQATQPIQNIQLKQQLELNKEKNDPKSELSVLVRQSLQNLGLDMAGKDNVSYAQLEKLYPSLTQALYTQIAAQSRKADRAESADSRAETRRSNEYFKTAQGIDRMVSQMAKSKPAVGYEQAKQAKSLLSQALNSKDVNKKVDAAAFFMNYAKTAQGDDSVVRSEDMKVLAGNLGFNSPTELLSKLIARAGGSTFSPGEMENMGKVLDVIMKVKKKQLHEMIKPMQKRAAHAGYDLGESLSQDYIDEITAPSIPSVEERAKRALELRAKHELELQAKKGK